MGVKIPQEMMLQVMQPHGYVGNTLALHPPEHPMGTGSVRTLGVPRGLQAHPKPALFPCPGWG